MKENRRGRLHTLVAICREYTNIYPLSCALAFTTNATEPNKLHPMMSARCKQTTMKNNGITSRHKH